MASSNPLLKDADLPCLANGSPEHLLTAGEQTTDVGGGTTEAFCGIGDVGFQAIILTPTQRSAVVISVGGGRAATQRFHAFGRWEPEIEPSLKAKGLAA
jgi:hypothetical protein